MASEDIVLRIDCAELDDSQLQAFGRDVARSLRNEGFSAVMASSEDAAPGSKGDPITIGAIILTLVQTGGVAITMLQVLKTFLERKPTLRFELTRADGRKVSLDASWFSKSQLQQTQKILGDLIKD
jgi:hypothetical protein